MAKPYKQIPLEKSVMFQLISKFMETEPHSIFSSPANGPIFSPHSKCLEHAFFSKKECRRSDETLIPICTKLHVCCRLFLKHRLCITRQNHQLCCLYTRLEPNMKEPASLFLELAVRQS